MQDILNCPYALDIPISYLICCYLVLCCMFIRMNNAIKMRFFLSNSSCPLGGFGNSLPQFGPGCIYRCHCVDDVQCDYNGNCAKGCAAGWMGPGCQYGDIAFSKQVKQLQKGWNVFTDGRLATDGLPTTCTDPATLVVIDLNANYRISGLVINLSDAVNLTGYEVWVENSSSDPSSEIVHTCFKQTITHRMDTSIDVVCTTEIVGRYLLIRTPDNATTMTLCDVRVYGGRSLAYGHNSSQSSTTNNTVFGVPVAARALDGDANTRFQSFSCTHTMDEMSPWWRVNLEVVYTIARIVLYGRSDCCTERLSGFSVSFATNSSFNQVFNYPMTTPPLVMEVITLSENYAQHVEISLRDINQSLTLCEVFIFGDCQDDMCGWICDIVCHCEGPIAKQNILDASCTRGCKTGWWGTSCNNTCDSNCRGNTCNQSDGYCLECAQGKWGHLCENNCTNCLHGTGCGISDGLCTDGCSSGRFGVNCSEPCGHCAGNGSCKKSTGACIHGCQPGWQDDNCTIACPKGLYGTNCSSSCGHCVNTSCDRINGTCPLGCSEGYSRPRCNEHEHPSMQPTYENIHSNLETDRKRDLPVKRTDELGANTYVNINRNETDDVEIILEGDRTFESKAENDHDNTYYNIGESSQRGGRRIAIHDLSDYVTGGSHLLNDIEEEFKKLLSGPQHEMNVALNPENRQKNRYKGMYAYDNNRVVLEPLPDDPNTDYINASFINGYKRDNAYIAAQGTIATTLNDFWRMIWQHDVQQIVMLTGLTEQGKHKCLQYWPNDGSSEYGMIRVEIIAEDVCTEYVIRSFIISKTGSKKQKTVNQFHFTSWPDRGVPETPSSLVQFWKKVRHSGNSHDAPILVHCSAGIGRTGTYIALDYSFDEGIEEGYVNIFECVNKLRRQRIGLVQTAEQYVYLHAVLLEAFQDMVGHVSADDFQTYYTQMRGIDSETKRIKLLAEFEKLQEDEYMYVGNRTTKDRSSEPKDEFLDGKLPENKLKNRCHNILPSERYRPYLSTYVRGHNDYINAVCLPTRKNRKGLLLTQMPLPDTVIDFWRLVYDYEVQSIVMLNEANLPGEAIGVYWPENDDTSRYGPFIVKITSQAEKGSHIERMLEVSKHGEEQTMSLKQFVCSMWKPNDSIPKSIDRFLNLIDDVDDWKRKSGERPILVHCMNGAERSGLFCVIWCVLEKLKSDREVAIRSVVRQLRIRRQQIIPNFEQYKFCHDVICFSLSKSTTYTNM
ncbi:hypothetical protein ACJMK2_030608 [Sinanodonta woodiana]|uniref:protein-tyrosine-phosphatase n=1 Tax=Sinanodonta woodiana TaxID=1069815 RepID=A0ABD3WZQ6_SINWO